MLDKGYFNKKKKLFVGEDSSFIFVKIFFEGILICWIRLVSYYVWVKVEWNFGWWNGFREDYLDYWIDYLFDGT